MSKYLGCLLLVSSNDYCCHLYYKIPLKYNLIKSIKQYCIHSKRTSKPATVLPCNYPFRLKFVSYIYTPFIQKPVNTAYSLEQVLTHVLI